MNETYDAIQNILTQDVLGSYTGLLSLSDLPLMIVASLVVLWLGVNQGRGAAHKRGDVVRWEGALLLAVYFIYLGVMIYQEAF